VFFTGGTILRTTDGGANWVPEISGTRNNLNGVSFVDADIGTAVGDRGNILRRTDGGGGSPTEQILPTSPATQRLATNTGVTS